MNTEAIVALFGGTTIASVITVLYTIFKERHSNTQKDMAGDLTLGELFRDAARKEVALVQHDIDSMRELVAHLQACKDTQARELRELRNHITTCEAARALLLQRWPKEFGPPPTLPD